MSCEKIRATKSGYGMVDLIRRQCHTWAASKNEDSRAFSVSLQLDVRQKVRWRKDGRVLLRPLLASWKENHAKSGKLLGILRGDEVGCLLDPYSDKGCRFSNNMKLGSRVTSVIVASTSAIHIL